ncbi:hypothetical protein BAX96_00925 [Elizabethkingia anophelis]|uniref:lantibiotic dehydratase n=1 Tax=Elizabethkingia anophelis TaxID=1117645 RepID=UPI00099A87E7|nr:lantibiotic dehydratase [Elizabethkingia anophelis]MCT3755364.1 lantibiotic dehydratase [Elizabethkingia anophelis]MCT4250307.1 lantibiotic dehydratase [Elizabethkingia anophelis]MCT4265694.1 lantibiotic dehydratase [Elizabethkingia anophelis]MCT4269302.1 lantibiotic dehydratase [Elizabethkingia anophelis]OPC28071.1 hypothetical protein BAX96_00925 [Elizabethkingia anophelis]
MNNTEYNIQDFCCLRIPSLPLDTVLDLNEKIKNSNLDNNEELIKILNDFFSNNFYKEAIYIASKDLYETFIELKKRGFHNKNDSKRFLITFYKYLSRMCSRPTPYGLFAGVTSASISDTPTNISFETGSKYRLVCQLNIHRITKLIYDIDPINMEVINKIKYFKNNTLYKLGNKIYYVEQFDNGRYIASNLSSVRLSEYIEIILECAEQGATVTEMIRKIINPNITEAQKKGFIKNLIKSQVLVSELLPSVSTENFTEDLLNNIDEKEINLQQVNDLKEIYNTIKKISTIDDIAKLRNYINNAHNSIISNDFYKMDLFYNMQLKNINKKIIEEISNTSHELMQVFEPVTSLALRNFIMAFSNKYEEKEVLLTQALDSNYGIGYEKVITGNAEYAPLLEGIPILPDPNQKPKEAYGRFEALRDNVFKQYCKTNKNVINIDEDIQSYLNDNRNVPNHNTSTSAYIFGKILAESAELLDNGEYKFFPVQCHAPFATRLLTRFTHGDSKLKEIVKKIAKEEQEINQNIVLAEVLTTPDDNYANITLYPTIRKYEIPFLSNSKLDNDHKININDILISIRNGRVILKSKKLNKEIIPCLSNTYNTTLAQPLYKFLADVASQNLRLGYFWDWKRYYNELFLPRIEYKKFIVSRARWLLKKEKINYNETDSLIIGKEMSSIKTKYNLPQYVVMSEGDNELLLDLSNNICQLILLKEINKSNVILYENIHTPRSCFIKEKNNKNYVNEIVIPLSTNKPVYNPLNVQSPTNNITRVFPPGSEWLFVKIYSGSKNIESILTEIISDFAQELLNKKVIDKWFFIKYNDPDYHLRVRFHCLSKNSEWYLILENLQKEVNSFFEEEQAVKIVVDSYTREIERYGTQTMEFSENIFFYDSLAICDFLSLIYGDEGEVLRGKFAFVNIDRLLDDFGYTIEDKKHLINNISESFINEFSFSNAQNSLTLTRSLNNKYRNTRHEIASIISQKEISDYKEAYECFRRRSESIKSEINENGIQLKQEVKDYLLTSYIHMSLNRFFLVNQRRHELVIYYFLNKYYESVIAQSKNMAI